MESGSGALFATANQAVSDSITSIRIVQAYNLQKQVRTARQPRPRAPRTAQRITRLVLDVQDAVVVGLRW